MCLPKIFPHAIIESVKRTVVFYRTVSGCPFENFLDSLPGGIVKKITWILMAAQELESVSDLYFKQTNSREDIRECHVEYGDLTLRILCFFYKRDIVILWGGIEIKFQNLAKEQEQKAIKYKNDFLLRRRNTWAT
jgi:hypothetical protein